MKQKCQEFEVKFSFIFFHFVIQLGYDILMISIVITFEFWYQLMRSASHW
jgi:hypothetical protein